jgi:GNAT superfamily N-acetyltransferase
MEETESRLAPVIGQAAPFWDRWTVARYLADEFMGQYRRERALLDELRPFLDPPVTERLVGQGERIGRLRAALDDLGRRRGTGLAFAETGRQLLDAVQEWCAEIDAAERCLAQPGPWRTPVGLERNR